MIYTHVAAALLGAAVAATGAWKVQTWRYTARDAERQELAAKEQAIRAQRGDTAAAGHEADKRQIEVEIREVIKEVERVVEKPVYREQCLDADGLRVLSDAIRGATPASQPASAVPRPGATD